MARLPPTVASALNNKSKFVKVAALLFIVKFEPTLVSEPKELVVWLRLPLWFRVSKPPIVVRDVALILPAARVKVTLPTTLVSALRSMFAVMALAEVLFMLKLPPMLVRLDRSMDVTPVPLFWMVTLFVTLLTPMSIELKAPLLVTFTLLVVPEKGPDMLMAVRAGLLAIVSVPFTPKIPAALKFVSAALWDTVRLPVISNPPSVKAFPARVSVMFPPTVFKLPRSTVAPVAPEMSSIELLFMLRLPPTLMRLPRSIPVTLVPFC